MGWKLKVELTTPDGKTHTDSSETAFDWMAPVWFAGLVDPPLNRLFDRLNDAGYISDRAFEGGP